MNLFFIFLEAQLLTAEHIILNQSRLHSISTDLRTTGIRRKVGQMDLMGCVCHGLSVGVRLFVMCEVVEDGFHGGL